MKAHAAGQGPAGTLSHAVIRRVAAPKADGGPKARRDASPAGATTWDFRGTARADAE